MDRGRAEQNGKIADLSAAVLYDWLRLQAAQPPQVRVKCFGSHKEHRHQHGSDKKDEVTVVDFDFYVCHLFFPEPEPTTLLRPGPKCLLCTRKAVTRRANVNAES